MISGWKRAAIENMARAFGKGTGSEAKDNDAEIEKLPARIGQLVVERDFWANAPVQLLGKRGRKW